MLPSVWHFSQMGNISVLPYLVARGSLSNAIPINDSVKCCSIYQTLDDINILDKAFIPHVRTMILLPVVLLSLLQVSFTRTVKTVLPQYTLERRPDCPHFSAKTTQATSSIDCAAKMIDNHLHGFRYIADGGTCHLLAQTGIYKAHCWKLVSQTG